MFGSDLKNEFEFVPVHFQSLMMLSIKSILYNRSINLIFDFNFGVPPGSISIINWKNENMKDVNSEDKITIII